MKTDSLTLLRQARTALRALEGDPEDVLELLEDVERLIVDECNEAWEDGYRTRDRETTREQW